jgi:hypothetical protein
MRSDESATKVVLFSCIESFWVVVAMRILTTKTTIALIIEEKILGSVRQFKTVRIAEGDVQTGVASKASACIRGRTIDGLPG